MTGFYSARHERERRERETPEKILEIAQKKGYFSVSLRYRDDWLRSRCAKLKKEGKLRGGKREGRNIIYYPLKLLEFDL